MVLCIGCKRLKEANARSSVDSNLKTVSHVLCRQRLVWVSGSTATTPFTTHAWCNVHPILCKKEKNWNTLSFTVCLHAHVFCKVLKKKKEAFETMPFFLRLKHWIWCEQVIWALLEAVSRDGSYLINIPLTPEGTFHALQKFCRNFCVLS